MNNTSMQVSAEILSDEEQLALNDPLLGLAHMVHTPHAA
jgi:hypothetical protein